MRCRFVTGSATRSSLRAPHACARALRAIEHLIVDIDLRSIGGSALTDEIEVPEATVRARDRLRHTRDLRARPQHDHSCHSRSRGRRRSGPKTYLSASTRLITRGYPDCRPEYIEAFERMANLATKAGVEGRQKLRIHTPLVSLTKAEIIKTGLDLGVDYSMTHSCYDPAASGAACGSVTVAFCD